MFLKQSLGTGKMAIYQKQVAMGGKGPRSSKLLQGVHIQTDRCYPCVCLIDTGKGFGESASTYMGVAQGLNSILPITKHPMRMSIPDPETETPKTLQGIHNFSHLDVSALSRSPPPPASCTGRDLWDWAITTSNLGHAL